MILVLNQIHYSICITTPKDTFMFSNLIKNNLEIANV